MSFFELYLVFCGSGFLCVLLMRAFSNVGWFGLYGSAPVGRLHYAGQRGLELVGIPHLCVICFHQKGMIASKKTAGILTICRANCVRTVCIFMSGSCFISKNENINGFGTTGLNFLFLT